MGLFSRLSKFLNFRGITSHARDGEACAREVSAAIILFDHKCGEIHKTQIQQIASILFSLLPLISFGRVAS